MKIKKKLRRLKRKGVTKLGGKRVHVLFQYVIDFIFSEFLVSQI